MHKTAKSYRFSLSLFLLLLFLATIAGILIFSTSVKQAVRESTVLQTSLGNKISFSDGNFDPNASPPIWLGQSVTGLAQELTPSTEATTLAGSRVLGDSSAEKWIDVDLANQRVRAYEGDQVIYEFPISSGKFFPTPTGEFHIWYKVKYTKMEGGVKGTGTYYYLPNVPYTMFFNQGFGLHGTYWHNNFGHPMSHGCVNMPTAGAEKLFYWSDPVLPEGKRAITSTPDNPGTRVVVHGQTPKS